MRPLNALRKRAGRRSAGLTLVETVVSAGVTLLLLGFALPAFRAAGDAGDDGAARVHVDAETRHALIKIARELENTSSTAVDGSGNPRLAVTAGAAPDPLVAHVTGGSSEMGGFAGTLGGDTNTQGNNADDDADDDIGGNANYGSGYANEAGAKGSGSKGKSHWGRERAKGMAGTTEFGSNSNRPRHANIPVNSVLTFQKVAGYTVGTDGAPLITWTTPVEYRVVGRKLMRTQDGQATVMCPVCVGFQVTITDAGTVLVTIVSQKRAHERGRIVADANQIEISPKN